MPNRPETETDPLAQARKALAAMPPGAGGGQWVLDGAMMLIGDQDLPPADVLAVLEADNAARQRVRPDQVRELVAAAAAKLKTQQRTPTAPAGGNPERVDPDTSGAASGAAAQEGK